jgi:hypothetical protein
MEAHDLARLATLVAAERSAIATALVRFRTHHLGSNWRGRSRSQAEAAHQVAIDTCHMALAALDDAEQEALRMWRAALAATNPLGG